LIIGKFGGLGHHDREEMSALAPTFPPAISWFHSVRVCTWLIANDCKQGLRKHLAGNTRRDKILRIGGVCFGIAFLSGLHFGAFALVSYTWLSPTSDQPALMAGLSTAVWSFLLFVMLSGGLVRALVVLHEQDDSNLLLSSPVSPRAILAGRLFGNALQSCLVDGFIVVPYINVRIFTFGGHPNFLWGYAVWFALAVIVTCVDGLFSFGLIRWLGLRRARFFAQAVPFLLIFGVTLFAGTLSVSVSEMSVDQEHMPPEMQERFIALSHTPLVWMAKAAAGDPFYLAMIFSAAVALAMITLRLTERAFIEGTQNVDEHDSRARSGTADGPFRAGVLWLEVRKNLRLIIRTPMMTVQCLAQALMPIGIACVLARDDVARAVAFFVIFAAGVLSGMFTIAAGTVEECGDLLAMAPWRILRFRYGKMLSGFLYPLGIALFVGLGLLIMGEGTYAGAILLGGIPLGLASSICGETFASPVRPGTKPKLLADPIMMIPLLGMQIISGAVAGGTVFAAAYSYELLALSLLATYLVLLLAIGLAQLRKPLF
jgi:ABC-2 type transport system permease protein